MAWVPWVAFSALVDWSYQVVMKPLDAAVPVLASYVDAVDPNSSWALVTEPLTVSVSDPAVGVNARLTRLLTPVPTNGPAVDVPLRVTVPVPWKLNTYFAGTTVTDCVDSVAVFSKKFLPQNAS